MRTPVLCINEKKLSVGQCVRDVATAALDLGDTCCLIDMRLPDFWKLQRPTHVLVNRTGHAVPGWSHSVLMVNGQLVPI